MKVLISVFLVFISFHAACQMDGFEISTSGLDSIKIGMSKGNVEKVLKTSLQLYDGSTSTIKDQDSAVTKWGCNNCTQKYIVRYGTINLLLTFFRFTLYKQTDYELVAISSAPNCNAPSHAFTSPPVLPDLEYPIFESMTPQLFTFFSSALTIWLSLYRIEPERKF